MLGTVLKMFAAPLSLGVAGVPAAGFAAYMEMKDGAKIFYEDQGKGQPIVLVHGWTCSSKFWRKNVPELAKQFRVVTLDLRGHGNSSKILSGHTIGQYARDVREIIVRLGLKDVFLAGWSMGGPVVLSYWEQFSKDSRLKALGLIDSCISPFGSAEWNSHGLKNTNIAGMHAVIQSYLADPQKYAAAFTGNMFKAGKASVADQEWIVAELTKIPPLIAVAIYSDFLVSDYVKVLSTVKVPTIVFAADSNVFKTGIAMGKGMAALLPKSNLVPVADGGHLLFYEQPGKFNAALAAFVMSVK